MKKLLLLVVAVAMGATFANAQSVSFGPKVGLNYAGVMTNDPDASGKALIAPAFGAFAHIEMGKLVIQPELMYSMQGVKSTDENGEVASTLNLNYINVPVMVKYNVAGGLNLQAGPQLGINVGANVNPNYTDEMKDAAEQAGVDLPTYKAMDINPIDFALNAGLGYEVSNFVIDARASLGLTNTIKELSDEELMEFGMKFLSGEEITEVPVGNYPVEGGDMYSMKNLTFQLSVGYKF